MAAGRALVGRRRRVGEEEDDDGPVLVDDSASEGSILSDADEDDESSVGGEASAIDTGAGVDAVGSKPDTTANGSKFAKKPRKARKKAKKAKETAKPESPMPRASFKTVADTEAMMNGLRIDDDGQEHDAVDFERMERNGSSTAVADTNTHTETITQRQRREHEDYRRKRDADPAFIPNRGNFFMHDTRGQLNGLQQSPVRNVWSGRGRGRGGPAVGGPFSPTSQMAQAERSAEQPWKHDLHDTINEGPTPAFPSKPTSSPHQEGRDQEDSTRLFAGPAPPASQHQPRLISFSSTTLVGKVQIRVMLAGMTAHITFSEVPWKHYVRLPNHRPPLRRDKPVRISLPGRAPQYIFPSPDRSFIFIPRQNRPNQPGYHRSYQRSVGGYGYSSRRTSMYGGSVYAPSLAASRRSSLAGISRADAFSPTSFGSGMPPATRPVVRLPYNGQQFSGITTPSGLLSGNHTPTGMQIHTYPLPQQPVQFGTPTNTVHQPRPQKAISVTGIVSPALLQQQNASSSTDRQLFQNQLPAHIIEQQPNFGFYSPRQQYAPYAPPPQQNGTPLSGIPEQAVHAPSFQPPGMSPYAQAAYYPHFASQQPYYFSPPGSNGYTAPLPMYIPPQGYGVVSPMAQPMAPQPPPQQPPTQPIEGSNQQQSGQGDGRSDMMAHEINGMVFYTRRSDLEQQQQDSQQYQPAENFVPSYAMPGLPPPTPAPETSAYYYPPMPTQMYYPPQGTQP